MPRTSPRTHTKLYPVVHLPEEGFQRLSLVGGGRAGGRGPAHTTAEVGGAGVQPTLPNLRTGNLVISLLCGFHMYSTVETAI